MIAIRYNAKTARAHGCNHDPFDTMAQLGYANCHIRLINGELYYFVVDHVIEPLPVFLKVAPRKKEIKA